jgi:Flp pilus assembly protein TadB
MRLDKLKPAWVRAGLILATILVFAWHVQAGFDPTLGAIAFALALGLVTFESGRQRAKRVTREQAPLAGPRPPAVPPPPRVPHRGAKRPKGR